MKIKYYIFLITILIFSCDSLPDDPGSASNPLDPSDPGFIPPQVTMVQGPSENEIVNSDTVTFEWQGNISNIQFRYKIDNDDWSEFSNATSTTFTLLDDEQHQFQVQGRYATGTEGDPLAVTFEVDAISPTALYLYPKRTETISGGSFDIELQVDVDDSISIVSAKLDFDPTRLRADNVIFFTNGILLRHGGDLIPFSNINNSTGLVEIDCAVHSGNPRNVIGIGKIAKVTFTHLSYSISNINISNQSIFRNSRNETVNINYFISGEIVIN